MRSAPGIDGVSNVFIKKVWSVMRTPLHRYAACCFEKGRLTDTFSTACVRLIPKKGDTTQIKNWRPISLLSCYYKIISRVINTRLGTVIDKITGRAQKAYSNNRYIHEVLINVVDSIRHCTENNVPGMLISIDQKKAFDSILHSYCNDAFAFFGFGENFIHMMNTLSTGRTARIILDNGKLSRPITLERGRPQGDSPSPRQYNIGEQVLLLKIDLDPRLTSVFSTPCLEKISGELFYPNCKSEAFADDTNTILRQVFEVAQSLVTILNDFETISGLGCNIEKSAIMFIGPRNEAEIARITDLGFMIVDQVKILGFDVDSTGLNVNSNFDNVYNKIIAIANTWRQFGLSLLGRIAISKTFLISQINYVGAIATPSVDQLSRLQSIIDNFVLGGIPMAKDRLYSRPNKGGLGLLSVENMIKSSQCLWLSRIELGGYIDTWRISAMADHNFSILNFRFQEDRHTSNPVVHTLGCSWSGFFQKFWNINHNFLSAPLISNPFFSRGKDENGRFDPGPVNGTVIGHLSLKVNSSKWLSVKFKDGLLDGRVRNFNEMTESFGIIFNFNTYLGIRRAVIHGLTARAAKNSDLTTVEVEHFIRKNKKGAKRYRKILEHLSSSIVRGSNVTNKYCELIDIDRISLEEGGRILGTWNLSFLPLNIRNFSFQLFNNSLPIGSRLVNRYRDHAAEINESCTFCCISKTGVPYRETFFHLFFECPSVSGTIANFVAKYVSNSLNHRDIVKFIFTGIEGTEKHELVDRVINVLFLYEIWCCKTHRKIPSFTTIEFNMHNHFDILVENNSRFKNSVLKNNNKWCRLWRQKHGHAHGHGRG